jgi:ribosome assembly protein RRB1
MEMDDGSDEEFGFTNKIYHQSFHMTFEWPCLSFDVLRDALGASRTAFPHTAYFVSATQTNEEEEGATDQLLVTRISNMQCTVDDDDLADDSTVPDPAVRCCASVHPSPCTRIRSMPHHPHVVATWAETGSVLIWDVAPAIAASNTDSGDGAVQAIFDCAIDDTGFGLAWSRLAPGVLAVGQNRGALTVWVEDQGAFRRLHRIDAHEDSLEDLVFSPAESDVIASCACDGAIVIWDLRVGPRATIRIAASEADVNVIDWNALQPNLVCSGADDGVIKVWDLRAVDAPAAEISYHQDPITSIEWNPADDAEFAVACDDGRVTIWDLSVEPADPGERDEGIPDQLMFEDTFEDPKELHYHPQIPGMIAVTGGEGFHVFIPAIEDHGEDDAA